MQAFITFHSYVTYCMSEKAWFDEIKMKGSIDEIIMKSCKV